MAAADSILFDQALPAVAASAAAEVRRCERFPLTATVRVGWIDDSKHLRYVMARGMNLSERGMAIQLGERLRMSALVHLDMGTWGLSTVGRVRSCVKCGEGWRIGVELSSPFLADHSEREQ